jgi:hypothetical protein
MTPLSRRLVRRHHRRRLLLYFAHDSVDLRRQFYRFLRLVHQFFGAFMRLLFLRTEVEIVGEAKKKVSE